MPLNPLFDQLENGEEQQLLADLHRESIEISGDVVHYVPRRLNAYDELFGEDRQSTYDTAYMIPVYIVSLDGYQGDKVFMSKFGVELRDRMVLELSRQMFEDDVCQYEDFSRPREGDLIFFDRAGRLFEIKFVDYLPTFYPLGSRPTYRVTCEVFEYGNEKFTTGDPRIDAIYLQLSTDLVPLAARDELGRILLDEDGRVLVYSEPIASPTDVWDDNPEIQDRSDAFVDFSEENPFNDSERF